MGKGVGPVNENSATKESSNAKGAIVHEGLFSKGCHSFQSDIIIKYMYTLIINLPHMTNIPSRSMEDWWFATTTQASGLFSRSVSPLTLINHIYRSHTFSSSSFYLNICQGSRPQNVWFEMIGILITSQSSPRRPERGIINLAPRTALVTLQGRTRERGIIRKLMNVNHK